MSKIVLQPAANKTAQNNYIATIEKPVLLETIKDYVNSDMYNRILEQYTEGIAYVWGVRNGKNNRTKKEWEKISQGDIVLFSKKKFIFSTGMIVLTFTNKELAQKLWGTDENGATWENIYFVNGIKNMKISYEKLNKIIGYKENYSFRGLQVLDQKNSNKLLSKFDLLSEEISEKISERDYRDYVARLETGSDLDIEGMVYRRREQNFLRYYLFSKKETSVCAICGKEFPVNMLATAHIKKRSECTKKEKLDYKNIVIPMCKLGCDDLYEKGYIYVQDGIVKLNRRKKITGDLEAELKKIENRKCEYYNESTQKYFKFHREKFGIEEDNK
ncbi:MAG: HNH endonuclease [Bacillota bacterium]|nr:HNH endonuclease [Bacillota bacterium]